MSKVDKEAEDLMALLGIDGSRPSLTLGRRTGTRIRILHGGTSATAAPAPKPSAERRREERLAPEQTRFAEAAKLRPGFDVRVLDIGSRGVLIEALDPALHRHARRAHACLRPKPTRVSS